MSIERLTKKQWHQHIDCVLAEIGLTLEVFLTLEPCERVRTLWGVEAEMMLSALRCADSP